MTPGRRPVELTDTLLRHALAPAPGIAAPDRLVLEIADRVRATRQPGRLLARLAEPPAPLFGPRVAAPVARLAWAAVLAAALLGLVLAALAAGGAFPQKDTLVVAVPTPSPTVRIPLASYVTDPTANPGPTLRPGSLVMGVSLTEVWVADETGLWRFAPFGWSGPLPANRAERPYGADAVVYGGVADGEGRLWLATSEGVYVRDLDRHWIGDPTVKPLRLARGPDGRVWGLVDLGRATPLRLAADGTIATEATIHCPSGWQAFAIAGDGSAWMGAQSWGIGLGVSHLHDGTCDEVAVEPGSTFREIVALVAAGGDTTAVVTFSANKAFDPMNLYVRSPTGWNLALTAPNSVEGRIADVAVDARGRIWAVVGTDLVRIDAEGQARVLAGVGPSLSLAPDGTLWFVYDGGVAQVPTAGD